MYFKNKNKLKKKIILTTLTATMLVSAFPIHQSSITIGNGAVYAEERQERDKSSEDVNSTIEILNEGIEKIIISSENNNEENTFKKNDEKLNNLNKGEGLDTQSDSNKDDSKNNGELEKDSKLILPHSIAVDNVKENTDPIDVSKSSLSPEELKNKQMLLEKQKAEAIAKAEAIRNKKLIRIAGKNRRETALGISKARYNFSDKAILVNQDAYADALTASVLSNIIDAPILLNSEDTISPETMYELNRLKAKEIVILGGESSISNKVEAQLNGLKINTKRIAGKDRYETSVKVAEKIYEKTGNNKQAVVVSGENFADAISMSPFAAKRKTPILLVKKDTISKEALDFLMYNSINKIYMAGGKNSISDEVVSRLPKIEERFEGSDRYETSEKIANYEYKTAPKIFVATGEDFADALAAGPMIADNDAPLLLVGNKGFTKGIKKYVVKSNSVAMVFIGGTKYIPDKIKEKLAEMPKPESKGKNNKKDVEKVVTN